MLYHSKMAHVYIGVDLHRQTHTATIIDCFGEVLGEITFRNRQPDFPKFEKEVAKYMTEGITPIYGLEDVTAYGRELAVYLMGRENLVKHVNPSLTKNERDSRPSHHKTDSFDSLCIARVLLTKMDELPNAYVDDQILALTLLVTKRKHLVKLCTSIKQQLHTYVSHHYPSYKQFFSLFECKTALAFWEKYPSPSRLKGTGIVELANFLSEESSNFFGMDKACEILNLVEEDSYIDVKMQEINDFILSSSVGQLRTNYLLIESLEERIKELLPTFGYQLETMKGISYIMAVSLIVEIGDINRFQNANHLASYAGISPVEYSSGEIRRHFSNKGGNRKLNSLIFFLAMSQCNDHGSKGGAFNGIFADYYKKKLSAGKTKKQATKCVMRRLINIIYRLMKDRCEYQPPKAIKKKE